MILEVHEFIPCKGRVNSYCREALGVIMPYNEQSCDWKLPLYQELTAPHINLFATSHIDPF